MYVEDLCVVKFKVSACTCNCSAYLWQVWSILLCHLDLRVGDTYCRDIPEQYSVVDFIDDLGSNRDTRQSVNRPYEYNKQPIERSIVKYNISCLFSIIMFKFLEIDFKEIQQSPRLKRFQHGWVLSHKTTIAFWKSDQQPVDYLTVSNSELPCQSRN